MEGYPVQEEQQDQGQMDSVLVKLQLELQQQLQPSDQHSPSSSAQHGDDASCTADAVSTQLLVARLVTPATPADMAADATVTPAAAAAAAPAGDDDMQDTTVQQQQQQEVQDAATDSMHSEITLRQSDASLDDAVTTADVGMADAIFDAIAHSDMSSLHTPSAEAADALATQEGCCYTEAETADAAEAEAAAAAEAATAAAAGLAQLTGSRAASDRCLSGTEDDWHLVSRGSSVKAPSSSGRYSFDESDPAAVAAMAALAQAAASSSSSASAAAAAVVGLSSSQGQGLLLSTPRSTSPFHEASDEAGMTSGSECGSDITPRDELAASILGQSVMMVAAAAATTSSSEAVSAAASPVRPSSPAEAAADGSIAAIAATETEPAAAAAAAGEVEAAAGSDSSSASAAEAAVVLDAREALGLLSGGLLQLAGGLREWIVESLAALVQTGRDSQAACMSRAAAALRSLQLSAKQSGGLAAAAATAAGDWRLLLSGAAAVVCLALWMKSRKEAHLLRTMLRRRDHELSKLVMRVVSLQELINQGGHLTPSISRYSSRFEATTATVSSAATYL